MPHYRKALEVSRTAAAADKSLKAQSTLRGAVVRLASAQLSTGDLESARDSFQTSLQLTEELLRRPDATMDTRHGLLNSNHVLGDILGSPDEWSLGDLDGALHYGLAIEIAERLVAADQLDVRSRDDLQSSYRRMAGQSGRSAGPHDARARDHARDRSKCGRRLGRGFGIHGFVVRSGIGA